LIRTYILFALLLLIVAVIDPGRANAQEDSDSTMSRKDNAAPDEVAAPDTPDWLFPVGMLDDSLPHWLFIGGEYRNRIEGPTGIGYSAVNDFYLLDRLRIRVIVQPKEWLSFHGEVQDSRIFFNYHTPNANPYEDTWTLWEGYAQLGSSTSGWVDVAGDRQVLLFGDQRVIGPSNWLNVGRTFNVARVELHQSDFKVNIFASSVVPGDNADLHNEIGRAHV
jgi:hypothetical protein